MKKYEIRRHFEWKGGPTLRMARKIEWRCEWCAHVWILVVCRLKFNEGANIYGALTWQCIKFSPRFPFPRCSGYGKRECAVPLGSGASPSRGSLRGKAKDRAYNWTFFEKIGKSRKMLEKVGKYSKKDRSTVWDLFLKSFFHRFLVDFGRVLGGFWGVIFVLFSKTSIL